MAKRQPHIDLPTYVPERDMALSAAYAAALDLFRDGGYRVEPHAHPLANAGLHGFLRAFEIPAGGSSAQVIVFVTTEPWTQQRALGFVEEYVELLLADETPQFHFLSAYPLAPTLDYIFAPWPAGALEADALLAIGDGELTTTRIVELAATCVQLVRHHLDVELELAAREGIATLNRLLLRDVRPCDDPTLALEPGAHVPSGFLAIAAAALGEVIRHEHPDQVSWVEPPENIGGDYPILELRAEDDDNRWYVFPFDKVLQVYQNGQDRDLETYYEVVIAATLAGERSGDLLDDYESAQDLLMPVLKPGQWTNANSVEGVALVPDGPIGTPVIAVAIDQPRQIAFVIRDKIAKWDVDFATIVGRACANLARQSRDMVDHFETLEFDELVVHRLTYNDYFNASRVLLSDALFAALQTQIGDCETYLVAVPNRDHLLAIGAPDPEGDYATFQDVVLWFHERQPAPISSVCFLLGAEGIIGYYGVVPNA